MEPCELEFIGEKTIIGVIPNFTMDPIHLISGSIGPFKAGLPVHVPLWLAIHMKKQQKCRIVPPDWMDVDFLEEVREEEKRSKFFTKMPDEHYMVISKLILCNAADDVPGAEEIRTKIKDIFDIRDAKLRTSIKTFLQGAGTYAKLDNLTQFEIHTVRPLLPHALDHIARYQRAAIAAERRTNTMSNSGFAGSSGANSFFSQ